MHEMQMNRGVNDQAQVSAHNGLFYHIIMMTGTKMRHLGKYLKLTTMYFSVINTFTLHKRLYSRETLPFFWKYCSGNDCSHNSDG